MSDLSVIVYKNGIKSNGVEVKSPSTIDDLYSKAASGLGLDQKVTRLFKMTGYEVNDVGDLADGEFLFASAGEDFIPIGGAAVNAGSSSSGLLDDDDDMDIDELEFDGKPLGFEELPLNYQEHLLNNLEEGEKVLWTDVPLRFRPFLRFIIIVAGLTGSIIIMSLIIDRWQAAVFLAVCGAIVTGVALLVSSDILHEYYALTTRRILILHAGCGPKCWIFAPNVKRSPVFSELTNFQVEVEEQFGIGSVVFRGTNLGFKYVNNAPEVAEMVLKRIPEAPPRALLKF